MKLRSVIVLILAIVFIWTLAPKADAGGVVVYKKDGKFIKIGGRVQLQYHYKDPEGGDSSDSVFFRRLRPYIEGSLHENWKAKIQWDMGKASGDNEVALKEAWFKYTGFDAFDIWVGNSQTAFSREDMTSSKKQHLVERTFVGDHNYGTPERNVGIFTKGSTAEKKIEWHMSFTSASLDPSSSKVDFDTPVNKSSDWNEGWMVVGRLDWHPLGHQKMSQGHFKGDPKVTVSVAAFTWSNDDDVSGHEADLDSVTGFEVSGAYRGHGFSVDAQYNIFDADAIDMTFTKGMYVDGTTELTNFSLEGGFMIIKNKLELAAGYQTQDADGYADEWTRTSFGVNYFWKKHDAKVQLTYRVGESVDGKVDKDLDEVFLQGQFVF